MIDSTYKPKIGIALSGASGRAIAHIGVLEVLKENNIPIDIMVGCSSGSMVAAAYGTDTLHVLKQKLKELNGRMLLSMWSTDHANGGLFQLKNVDPHLNLITQHLSFEDIKHVKLGFVATDLHTGEIVNITSGDLLTAFKAAAAVPGLFEPVVMNNRVLVDGGLVNIVPTVTVKEMGADIVIGINIASSKFVYEKQLPIWRGFRFITKVLGLQFFREKIWPKLSSRILFKFDSQSDTLEQADLKIPGMLSVLAKALDHSLRTFDEWEDSKMACDIMLEPRVKTFGKTNFNTMDKAYEEGRRCAQQALPQIRKLIANFNKRGNIN